MRNKIWYELIDAKYGELYLANYINRCKNVKKKYKILTLVFSGGGVFGWSIWEPVAFIACIIIALIQLINLIENQLIKSDEELLKISSLRSLYLKYFNQLEKLWSDFENEIMDEKQASESFFTLRSDIKEKIEKLDNEVHVRQIRKLLDKTDREEKLYFNNRYG